MRSSLTRGATILLVLVAGCGFETSTPYNPGFGDHPPEINFSCQGDYRLRGSVETRIRSYDSAGGLRGEIPTSISGPRVELERNGRRTTSVRLADGEFSFLPRQCGWMRVWFGDEATELVYIDDGKPAHRFPPFVQESFGQIRVVPNPAPGPLEVRFPTGGYFWIKVIVEGDSSFGSPVTFQRTLFDDQLDAGEHAFPWDGLDPEGQPAPPGVYRARVWVSTMGWLWHEYLVLE